MGSVQELLETGCSELPEAAVIIEAAKDYREKIGIDIPDEEAGIQFWIDSNRSAKIGPLLSLTEIVNLFYSFFAAKRRIAPHIPILTPADSQTPAHNSSHAHSTSHAHNSSVMSRGSVTGRSARAAISLETSRRLFSDSPRLPSPGPRAFACRVVELFLATRKIKEGDSDITASQLIGFYKSGKITDPLITGCAENVNADKVLSDYVAGNFFSLEEIYKRRYGYGTRDISALYHFWISMNPSQKNEAGIRGFSNSQVLTFLTSRYAAPAAATAPATPAKRPRPGLFRELSQPRLQSARKSGSLEQIVRHTVKEAWSEVSADFKLNTQELLDALFSVSIGSLPAAQQIEASRLYGGRAGGRSLEVAITSTSPSLPSRVGRMRVKLGRSVTLAAVEMSLGAGGKTVVTLTDHRGRSSFSAEILLQTQRRSTARFDFSSVVKDFFDLEISPPAELFSLSLRRSAAPLASVAFADLVDAAIGRAVAPRIFLTLDDSRECRFSPSSRAASPVRREVSTLRLRWGVVNRARALFSQGKVDGCKNLLSSNFNIPAILAYFTCQAKGCAKPLVWNDGRCPGCSQRFCMPHCSSHSCRGATAAIPGIPEHFDNPTELAVIQEALSLWRELDAAGSGGGTRPSWKTLNGSGIAASCDGACGPSCARCAFNRLSAARQAAQRAISPVRSPAPRPPRAPRPPLAKPKSKPESIGAKSLSEARLMKKVSSESSGLRRMCLAWLQEGACTAGNRCLFAHSPLEREMDTPDTAVAAWLATQIVEKLISTI